MMPSVVLSIQSLWIPYDCHRLKEECSTIKKGHLWKLYMANVLCSVSFEFIGTFVLILLGCGVCACVSLRKSKGEGGGWIVVTLAWGLAVFCGVLIAGPWSGAHLNPAVTIGLAASGESFLGHIPDRLLFLRYWEACSARCVYMYFTRITLMPLKARKPNLVCSLQSRHQELLAQLPCEVIGTFVLVLVILLSATKAILRL